MILKISELEKGIGCVYKITYPNGKVYVGCTKDVKRRMGEHNSRSSKGEGLKKAHEEYGNVDSVEILYVSDNIEELEDREAFWISECDSTNPNKGYNISSRGNAFGRKGDDSPLSKVTDSQVLDIRKRKMNGESRRSVYLDYKDQLSLKSGFDRIWNGESRRNIAPDIIKHFEQYDKHELISNANKGSNNGRSKLNEENVRDIRALYDSGLRVFEICEIYNFISYNTVSRVCKRETWKHV